MPYNEMDHHCLECICPSCEIFQTDECLEDADGCDRCDNNQHVENCWWYTNEEE